MTDLRNIEITEALAAKVLAVVDAGLVSGVGPADSHGRGKPGHMCVEAAVCYALGLPHSDDPQCVSRAVRSLKIRLNDSEWSSNKARAQGLRRLAIAQLGSRDKIDDMEFARRVADLAIRQAVPRALRAAASIQKDAEHRDRLLSAANKCEIEGTRASALEAKDAANAAAYAAYAYAYAADAAHAAAYAAYADADAADADDAAHAAANAAEAVEAAAYAYAANVAADKKEARDESLASFAEEVVQILVSLDAPGCQFLNLTEARQ